MPRSTSKRYSNNLAQQILKINADSVFSSTRPTRYSMTQIVASVTIPTVLGLQRSLLLKIPSHQDLKGRVKKQQGVTELVALVREPKGLQGRDDRKPHRRRNRFWVSWCEIRVTKVKLTLSKRWNLQTWKEWRGTSRAATKSRQWQDHL